MARKIIVTKSEFICSAVNSNQYPAEKLPEFVFVGRSNVGKSSLINSLTGRKNLAHFSKTPGKTQTINFFKVTLRIDDIFKSFYLVDLPGYGYAKTSKSIRRNWAKFVELYLLKSPNIKCVFQLIDIRHPPMDSDLSSLHWLFQNNLPSLILATKSDKLSYNKKNIFLATFKYYLPINEISVVLYSSIKNDGRSELLDVIANSLLE